MYCDDGLAVCSATPKQIEKTKQEINKVFKANNLNITIEANKKIVHFLEHQELLNGEVETPQTEECCIELIIVLQQGQAPAAYSNILPSQLLLMDSYSTSILVVHIVLSFSKCSKNNLPDKNIVNKGY